MQNDILLLSHSSFQNNNSDSVTINTRKYDNLLIFAWTTKYLHLDLNLALELELSLSYLDLDLDVAESLCIWELKVWITTLFSTSEYNVL